MKKHRALPVKIHKNLQRLEKEFSLSRVSEYYRYLVLPKEEIVLRNFLGECPSPDFDRYGGRRDVNRARKIEAFAASAEFRRHSLKAQGCLIPASVAKQERKLSMTVENAPLRRRLLAMYDRIIRHSDKRGTVLLSQPNDQKEERIFSEILTHELIHQLLIGNGIHFYAIRPSLWKWDEGLCVYLERFLQEKHPYLLKKPRKTKNNLWNHYILYAHKWAKLLTNDDTPAGRLRNIRGHYAKKTKTGSL